MDIYCKVTTSGLIPLTEMDWEKKCRLPLDSEVKVSITRQRNIRFHRKFFALLRLTLDNMPHNVQQRNNLRTMDDMLAAIKIDLGYFDTVKVGRRNVARLGSISFASMDEDAFETFYNLAVTKILSKYLAGTDRQALLDEVEQFISRP